MKKINKLIILSIVFMAFSVKGSSQNVMLDALNGFNRLAEEVGNFFKTASKVDSIINNKKVKNMAAELYDDVGELILVKDSLVMTLAHTSFDENKYKTHIYKLQETITTLKKTLYKYDELLKAAGVNAQALGFALKQDITLKARTLDTAKDFIVTNASSQQTKQNLITYFKACVNILKHTQSILANYKG